MASECCLYKSAIDHPTPSTVAVSNAATLEILTTSTEMGTTGAMNVGATSESEMVTATLVTAPATHDLETSTNSSMFFVWIEFLFF